MDANLHIKFILRTREDKDFLDLLSISMFLKLKYGSSALKSTSTRSICNKLHIGLDKFKRLKQLKSFGEMFRIDEKTFTARTLRKRGRYFKICYNEKSGKLSVLVGKKEIFNDSFVIGSYKDIKRLIQKLLLFLNVHKQESVVYSGMVYTGTDPGNSDPKSEMLPIFAGCSNRRMAYKSGMSMTKMKNIKKECIKDGMIWSVQRRNVALSTKGMSDEEAVRTVDRFMLQLDFREGERYFRSKSGKTVYHQMSNVYGTRLGDAAFKMKKVSKTDVSSKSPIIENIEVYEPDINEYGVMAKSDILIASTGEIIERDRVPFDKMEAKRESSEEAKKMSKTQIRKMKMYHAIKSSLSEEEIKEGYRRINEALGKSWISPKTVLNTGIKIIKNTVKYQREMNNSYRKIGAVYEIQHFDECIKPSLEYMNTNKDVTDVLNLLGIEGIIILYLRMLVIPVKTVTAKELCQSLPGRP